MTDDQNRAGSIDASSANGPSGLLARESAPTASGVTMGADPSNAPLLSRPSAPQPRKSLFRR